VIVTHQVLYVDRCGQQISAAMRHARTSHKLLLAISTVSSCCQNRHCHVQCMNVYVDPA